MKSSAFLRLAPHVLALLACCVVQRTHCVIEASNRSEEGVNQSEGVIQSSEVSKDTEGFFSSSKVTEEGTKLKHAVKSMLGFKELPLGTPPNDMAPQYMKDLYEKYKSGRIQSGRVVANTVRSIHAEIGLVRDNAMFIFNLSSVAADEEVISGELHILTTLSPTQTRTKLSQGSELKSDEEEQDQEDEVVAQIFRLAPSSISELTVKDIPTKSRRGWKSVSITSAVKACLRSGSSGKSSGFKRNTDLLAMYFGQRNSDGKVSSLSMSKVLHMFSRPFLVVYSNASQNISVDHVSPHFTTGVHGGGQSSVGASRERAGSYVDPATGEMATFGNNKKQDKKEEKRRNRKHNKRRRGERRDSDDDIFARARRSIIDNELPDHDFETPRRVQGQIHHPVILESNVPRTHPTILQGRGDDATDVASRDRGRDRNKDLDRGRLLPYPEDYKEYRQERRRQRRRRKHQQQEARKNNKGRTRGEQTSRKQKQRDQDHPRLLPDYWESKYNSIDPLAPAVPVPETCGLRRLTVDFADIGWNEWIISPPSFQANYCAGACNFPLSQGVRPSNHATIQSILQAIGIHPDVPAPCCVPDVVSSLTLLYIDENSNVVLKNYPSMTVESCACR